MRVGIVFVLLLALACGYRVVDPRGVYGPDVNSIRIDMFDNESAVPGFERMLSDALVEEFARRGVLEPLYRESGGRADLIMIGVVSDIEVRPSAFSSVALTVEDSLLVVMDVQVMRASTQEQVWFRNGLRASERFLASPDAQVYQSNKEQALRRLTSEFAGRIHDELFQRF